ncbi:MAG: selenium-dependent xanthine dehydrogenase [Eubacteriales bacterium]|nr:selenium-dependent xanthine dehydrogenase [Eubacteriales bacterium]
MATFFVNGQSVTVEGNRSLLRFLRDDLKLTSVKNGCAEGACGTCTVLIDGAAKKACVQKTDRLEGKSVLTVEGLSAREKEVFAYAFSEAGAVQCGFCIPGMVICAKGLIDQVPEPSPSQVKEAIKNNICRCTGYVKIEQAILLAAKLLREDTPIPAVKTNGSVGESLRRVDVEKKTLGTAKYADDLYFPGMLLGSAVRSAYPRARVLAIHTDAAKAIPGVMAVITAEDIPGAKKVGHLKQDWDVLVPVGKCTHYLGDAIVLVAAKTQEALDAAKAAVQVEYEALPPVLDPAEALREGAPTVHEGMEGNLLTEERLIRGHAREKIAASKYVVTNHYSVPFTEHAFLEPECAVAVPAALDETRLDYGGSSDYAVHVYSGDQGIYQTQKECAAALGLEPDKVRVTAMMVGGGFGGKEDMSVQHHAALLAYLTNKPVKVALTRAESILVHPKRHAMEMDFTTACDENGTLTAMQATLVSDTGAYASLGGPVLQRACTHAAGPYNYQDIEIIGRAAYTNNPPAGAFRGFGVTQSCFATECNLNQLAELAGISPFEIRYRNAIRPGQVLPNGQIADESTALAETLDAVRAAYEKNPKAGIACAMKNSGLGVGIPDVGRCILRVKGGRVHVYSSAACIGQGMGTVQTQMVCSVTGLSSDTVVYEAPDTHLAPNAGNTTASRQTVFTGEAAARAAEQLLSDMRQAGSLAALEGKEYLGEYSGVTDKMGSDKPNPVSHIAYGYATHLVELDDEGRLLKVTAVHDVGQAVNPTALTGQIEGGVVMSLGYALTEDYPLEQGKPMAKFGTLGLFKADKTPPIDAVVLGAALPKSEQRRLAFGAKGVGEICSIPTPPAVQLAYYNRDGVFRTKLPLSGTPYSRKK